MDMIDELLAVARAYAAAEGIGLSTLSGRATGDTKKLPALVSGADIQVRRFTKTMQWFSDHWPDNRSDVPWPAGIDRPPRARVVREDAA